MSPARHDPGSELVDVVADDGHTVAVVTRREMRLNRLPHRCVYVLVFNRRGDIFAHLRTAAKDVYPAHWDVAVGGVLTAGETFTQGVAREVHEELGVTMSVEEMFPFRYEDARTSAHAMVYRALHEGPFALQTEEIVRGEFLSVEDVFRRAEREPFCPDGLMVLREYLKRQTNG